MTPFMKNVVLIVAVIAVGGVAVFGWREHQLHGAARVALAESNALLKKAQIDVKTMGTELEALRKQSAEHKAALDHQQLELRAAQSFLETERAASARLREELVKMKEALALAARSRGAPPPSQAGGLPPYVPMLHRPPPAAVRIAPGGGATAFGAPAPALPAR
jgi:hypothetical protein